MFKTVNPRGKIVASEFVTSDMDILKGKATIPCIGNLNFQNLLN